MSSVQSNALPQDRVLVVSGEVQLELRDGAPWIAAGGESIDAGPQALMVLDLFRQPCSVADAMRRLTAQNRDPRIWMQVSATIYNLFVAGVLHEPGKSGVAQVAKPLVKSGVQFQARMLNDRVRTEAFLRAIRSTVRPGDVVLDLGTGTGVLAIEAAKAGGRVYAMEMTSMADVAEQMYRANGVQDRITLLRGMSTGLELPEKADVLVTEIIGDGPLDERVLECVADARRRLLKPDARIIPQELSVYLMALSVPDDLKDHHIFSTSNIARWSGAYGIDFSAAAQACEEHDLLGVRISTADFLRCKPVSSLALVRHFDLRAVSEVAVQEMVRIPMNTSGMLDGFVCSFDLTVSAQERISTVYPGCGPLTVDAANAWRIPVWLCLCPGEVKAGQSDMVSFQYADGSTRLAWLLRR